MRQNFPLVSIGVERRVLRVQTRERGPPSALAEFVLNFNLIEAVSKKNKDDPKTNIGVGSEKTDNESEIKLSLWKEVWRSRTI